MIRFMTEFEMKFFAISSMRVIIVACNQTFRQILYPVENKHLELEAKHNVATCNQESFTFTTTNILLWKFIFSLVIASMR